MSRTPSQNKQLFALLHFLQLEEERGLLAEQFSHGRTAKTSELSVLECNELIRSLQNESRKTNPKGYLPKPGDAMRKKIIAILCQCGYLSPEGRPDLARMDAWLLQYGTAKKKLNDMNPKELQQCCKQVEIYQVKNINETTKGLGK